MASMATLISALSLLIGGIFWMSGTGTQRRNPHYSRHERVIRFPRHVHKRIA